MSWNYRLFKQHTPEAAKGEGEYIYFVGECYYDEDNNPELHSNMDYNLISGSDPKEAKETYGMIGEAFKAPLIKLDAEGNFK